MKALFLLPFMLIALFSFAQSDSLQNYFEMVDDSVLCNASNFEKAQLFFRSEPEFIKQVKENAEKNHLGVDYSLMLYTPYSNASTKFQQKEMHTLIVLARNVYLMQLKLFKSLDNQTADPKKMNMKLIKKGQDKYSLFYMSPIRKNSDTLN